MTPVQPVSVLSDGTIKRLVREGRIRVDPWDDSMVQPASLDVRLGRSFRVFHNHRIQTIDLAAPPTELTEHVTVDEGETFVIHPGEFVLGGTAEWVELPDDLVARIEGKALALDTPVPTPSGWTTMGDLEVGDLVFDADGRPTAVIDATEPLERRECREVVFSDGTTVVADVDHRWALLPEHGRRQRLPAPVLTTGAIARDIRRGDEHRHHIALTGPVEYPRVELPIDPYLLGLRIGRRTTREAALAHVGPSVEVRPKAGLVDAGAIPAEYLTASVAQRRALLEGLIDAEEGLTAVDAGLAEQYRELVASLGLPSVVGVNTHAVADVRPVASVPVRCVQVASARGLFLVSRSFIPTHNSSLGRLGLIVHATAGFVDPGFKGTLTLEITNFNSVPIVLRPQLPIAQLSFLGLDQPAEVPYGHPDLGSHYLGQRDATESRYEGGRGERS
jgi:deoxycytidine triphosphate deaminase